MACQQCNGTGRVPAIGVFSGKPIPNAFRHCTCCQCENCMPYASHNEVQPDDFDYPLSYDTRRAICQQNGWPDPGSDKAIEQASTPVAAPFRPRPVHQELDRLQGELIHIGNIINEHIKRQKPQGEY